MSNVHYRAAWYGIDTNQSPSFNMFLAIFYRPSRLLDKNYWFTWRKWVKIATKHRKA